MNIPPQRPFHRASPIRAPRKKWGGQQSGFALIATISVMVLLVMIALAMLSLSTLELRSANSTAAQNEAKSNARMALMMAIGELQKHSGPDQRVTAEADILSSDGFHGSDCHPSRKHYLGIYSTEDWHKRDSNGIRESWKPYNKNRNTTAFRRWLVSGETSNLESLDFATQAPTDPTKMIKLLGEGTVGNDSSEHIVHVPYVELSDATGKAKGHLAWWVGDEGVKARVNLADSRKDTSHPQWTNKRDRMNPTQMGMEGVTGFENLTTGLSEADQETEFKKLISYDQATLFNGNKISQATLKNRFHDVTTHSRGVLSDVALGGLKRDLSLPFELPNLPVPNGALDRSYPLNSSDLPEDRDADYTSMLEFNNSGDQRSEWISQEADGTERWSAGKRPDWWAKKVGYVFSYPGEGSEDQTGMKRYLRGTSWDMLRNHYRLYKRELESDPSHIDRQLVRDPSSGRTWLARPTTPPSTLSGAKGQTPLTLTYVGDFGPISYNPKPSDSLLNPFYSYANAVNNRYWNNRSQESLGLVPVMTRLAVIIGCYRTDTRGGNAANRFYFTFDAVGTLWNPYNVAVETEAVFSDVHFDAIEMKVDLNDGGEPITLPFKNFRFGVTAETDPAYFSGDEWKAPSKLLRLEPGELRTYTLNFDTPKNNRDAQFSQIPGAFSTNAWTGGLYEYYTRSSASSEISFSAKYRAGGKLKMQNHLGFFQTSKGIKKNPFRQGQELHDLPHINGIFIDNPADVPTIKDEITDHKVVVPFQGANDQFSKKSIMKLEFKLRAGDSISHGIARDFDPRSIVNHVKAAGLSDQADVPANWDVSIEPLSDYSAVNSGFGTRNNGFWGSSHEGGGESHVVFFEVPDAPPTSLGSLQHCQTGPAVWDQPYAIGGSFAPKKLNQNKIFQTTKEQPEFENVYYDSSYLMNSALWDRYYFTGLSLDDPAITANNSLQAAESIMTQFLDETQENPLANRRLSLANNSGSSAPMEELTHYRWIARHLMLDGAFNINSTRPEAWKAWLSSLKGADVDSVNPVNSNITQKTNTETPFSRSVVTSGDKGDEWLGYSSLTDQEVSTLANEIVKEVKKRGPFLSVADFVNRRISNDDTGKEGALQAALRAASLDIGSGLKEGILGTIRQGDILSSLGACVTARSDTFVVRSYGDSVDATGKVLASAWCEAIVQRTPTPIDDNGELLDMPNPTFPGKDPSRTDAYTENTATAPTAKKFGRTFRIISFRWLSKSEV